MYVRDPVEELRPFEHRLDADILGRGRRRSLPPLLVPGQLVVDGVIVRFVGGKYVLRHDEAGRRIQSSGCNADRVAARQLPEQIAAAAAAEAPLGGVLRPVPDQLIGSRQFVMGRGRAGHGREMSAGAPALRAVAADHAAQLPAYPIADPAAQASAGVY